MPLTVRASIPQDGPRPVWARALPPRFDYGVVVLPSTEGFPKNAIQIHLPRLVEDYFHVETWRSVDHHEAHARGK